MEKLPRITVITPSYNQGNFIEQTIQSVLGQDYPDLEYLVFDGGSTDQTVDILKQYGDRFYWVSERDRGQSDAINKGLRQASGEIVAYLNSDDLYLPGTLERVGRYFAQNPSAAWLTGMCRNIDENGQEIRQLIRAYKNLWLRLGGYRTLLVLNFIAQPATFWRRSIVDEVGYLDEGFHYVMDYEYWLRIGQSHKLHVLQRDLAAFRLHSTSKSGTTAHKQFEEELQVGQKYGSGLPIFLHRLHKSLVVWVYKNVLRLEESY